MDTLQFIVREYGLAGTAITVALLIGPDRLFIRLWRSVGLAARQVREAYGRLKWGVHRAAPTRK